MKTTDLTKFDLTANEIEVLRKYGAETWFEGYMPSIYIDDNNGELSTPSCESVEEAETLRAACCKIGRGYYNGQRHMTYEPTKTKTVARASLTEAQIRILEVCMTKEDRTVGACRDYPWNTIKSLINKGLLTQCKGWYRWQICGYITEAGIAVLAAA
jgi:hypothetical protein